MRRTCCITLRVAGGWREYFPMKSADASCSISLLNAKPSLHA
jgi:hypothetical protein